MNFNVIKRKEVETNFDIIEEMYSVINDLNYNIKLRDARVKSTLTKAIYNRRGISQSVLEDLKEESMLKHAVDLKPMSDKCKEVISIIDNAFASFFNSSLYLSRKNSIVVEGFTDINIVEAYNGAHVIGNKFTYIHNMLTGEKNIDYMEDMGISDKKSLHADDMGMFLEDMEKFSYNESEYTKEDCLALIEEADAKELSKLSTNLLESYKSLVKYKAKGDSIDSYIGGLI